MPGKNSCPDAAVLQMLLQGQLSQEDSQSLTGHVEQCSACSSAVQSISQTGHAGPGRDETLEFAKTPRYGFLAPAQDASELGRLGPYRVLRLLGEGGMGLVFLAEDPALKRSIALKVMKPALAAVPACRERFVREAQAAAAIKHDHIVTVYQVGEDRGTPFIAMELLDGEPLNQRLQREGRFSVAETLRVGREIAEGLAAAHSRGQIHRDIKPANIWLDAAAGHRVKILDFGLARIGERVGEQHLTHSGAVVGTPSYMAPEQAKGQPVDGRADLFSLGVILYRLCTGVLPFKGNDTLSTLTALAIHNPPPPIRSNPKIPQSVSALVMRLLEKDPSRRIPTAAAVVQALRSLEQLPPQPPGRKPPLRIGIIAVAMILCGIWVYVNNRRGESAGLSVPRGDSANISPGPSDGSNPPPDLAANESTNGWKIGRQLRCPFEGPALGLAFSPDGEWLVGAFGKLMEPKSAGDLYAWNVASGELQAKIGSLPGPIRCLAFSADGTALAAATGDWDVAVESRVVLYDVSSAKSGLGLKHRLTAPGNPAGSFTLAFSPDGDMLASGGMDGVVRLWNARDGKLLKELKGHTGKLNSVAFTRNGRLISGSADGTVRLWSVPEGESLGAFPGTASAWIPAVALLADETRVAAVTGAESRPAEIHCWDAVTRKRLATIDHGPHHILSAVALGTQSHLVTGAADGKLRIWDLETRQLLTAMPGAEQGRVWAVAASRDDHTLAASGAAGTVQLWGR